MVFSKNKNMKHIVSIFHTSSPSFQLANYDEVFQFQGEKVRISQYALNYNLKLTEEMIKNFDGKVDAIALYGFPFEYPFKKQNRKHSQTKHLFQLTKETLVLDGKKLSSIYIPWALKDFCIKNKSRIKNHRLGLFSGLLHRGMVGVFEEYKSKLLMADPYFYHGLPFLLKNSHELDMYERVFGAGKAPFEKLEFKCPSKPLPFHRSWMEKLEPFRQFAEEIENYVSFSHLLNFMDLAFLKDKTLVLDSLDPLLETRLKQIGVKNVITCFPEFLVPKKFNFAILEALLQVMHNEAIPLSSEDILDWVDSLSLKPQISFLNTSPEVMKETALKRKTSFAFVVHPLHDRDLFLHPILKKIEKPVIPLMPVLKKVLHQIPPIQYGKILGIRSEATGVSVEGTVYSIFHTPSDLMNMDPESVYRKLITVSERAASDGAEIMGLGAYTKIVGDAGVTVARRSPIPVTTGNSLSAASTLWASHLAIKKMGLVKKNEEGVYQGVAMIIGATGSIGAVAAKMLAKKWKEIILVAPNAQKLLEIKEQIKEIAPKAYVRVSTKNDRLVHECDLIITSTSNQGRKLFDIMKVRPGCVICDVSRPFDITEEDAIKRPDVLVLASGEVELPGQVTCSCDLGLDGSAVYACLAETAILAMEGRFESFTLSRNISFKKVSEIDEMARKHGVRLAKIMGHSGVITDSEIQLCREHALRNLNSFESINNTINNTINKTTNNNTNNEGKAEYDKRTFLKVPKKGQKENSQLFQGNQLLSGQ